MICIHSIFPNSRIAMCSINQEFEHICKLTMEVLKRNSLCSSTFSNRKNSETSNWRTNEWSNSRERMLLQNCCSCTEKNVFRNKQPSKCCINCFRSFHTLFWQHNNVYNCKWNQHINWNPYLQFTTGITLTVTQWAMSHTAGASHKITN